MSGISRPVPVPTLHSKPFWDACLQHELRVQRCVACGTFRFPPLPSCVSCASMESEWVKLNGRGTVYSYTVARHVVHPAFDEIPYVIALVELEGAGGARLTTRLIDSDPASVSVGAAVEVVFADVDGQLTLPLFRLLL